MTRDKILDILEKDPGGRVSGEQLSRVLGVSRTAVWKQIKALRGAGYLIEGSPRTGYLLKGVPDLLYPREIGKGLATRTFGREIFHFRRLGSTNQAAFDLARRGHPEGTVVVAEEQTAGRGRWQRSWFSPPETGIWLSLILRPEVSPVKVPQVTLVIGAACARAIHGRLGIRPAIKWPNDLLYNGRKICGILVEMEATAEQVHFLVAGIGINVNQEASDFPPEILETAVSLRMIKGERVPRVPLVRSLLENLEEDYRDFCDKGFAGVRERWLRYETTLGEAVRVQLGGEQITGVAEDLDEEGNLLLRLKDGKLRRINSGELILCRRVDNGDLSDLPEGGWLQK